MTGPIVRIRRFVTAFCDNTSGIILPYAALLMVVFVGLMGIALDGGRQASLQTQLQSVADALALAGARELDQRAGAQTRAANAMNTMVSNGITGLGYSGTITHTVTFYSSLNAATAGFGGTAATSDTNSKFVGVTVAPASIDRTLRFVGLGSQLTAGAQAIAGFTAKAACDFPPVFICNPYEAAGNTDDATATAALRTNLADPTVTRKLIRMDQTKTSPGHFGFLVPEGQQGSCKSANGASCLKDYIAKTHPNTCYQTNGVSLNTGAMNSVYDAFNVRFDLYGGSLKYSAAYAPAINVRKGYLGGSGGSNKWCSASPANPYYTLPIISGRTASTTSGTATLSSITNASQFVAGNPLTVAPPAGMNVPLKVATPMNASSITAARMSGNGSVSANSTTAVTLASKGATSGLPLDSNMYADKTIIFGNGDWNCLDYWTINHQSAAAPSGCTKTNPTISRYQIYRKEIELGLVGNWSAGSDGSYPTNVAGNGPSESGAPYCAGTGNGVDPSMGNDPTTNKPYPDRRVIYAAVINCSAQANAIGNGANADNVPIADFAKFFLTQPAGISNTYSDPNSLYGEMTGTIASLDSVTFLNQVQLYR